MRDPAALGAALASFFGTYDLPPRGVRLGLANTRIGVRVIEIAGVEDSASSRTRSASARTRSLVPLDEAVIDYHVVDEDRDEEGR